MEYVPCRPQNFVNIRNGVGPAPPRGIPRNAVMLVNHQIKLWLPAIPLDGLQNGGPRTAAANDLYSFNSFFPGSAGEIVGEPKGFMAAPDQLRQVSFGHPLGAASLGGLRIPPA